VLASGTVADKVAALALLVQEDPLSNVRALETLLAACRKSGKRESLLAVDALAALFHEHLLPTDRALVAFDEQPLHLCLMGARGKEVATSKGRGELLVHWFYEDRLKEVYRAFVDVLGAGTQETVPYFKTRVISHCFTLLTHHPEEERRILGFITNKLGDRDRKVSSKVIYMLNQLLRENPGMKDPVARDVSRFMFRPGVGERAQYYAVVFLNQIMYSDEDAALAEFMIDVYFRLFIGILRARGEYRPRPRTGTAKDDGDAADGAGNGNEEGEEGAGTLEDEVGGEMDRTGDAVPGMEGEGADGARAGAGANGSPSSSDASSSDEEDAGRGGEMRRSGAEANGRETGKAFRGPGGPHRAGDLKAGTGKGRAWGSKGKPSPRESAQVAHRLVGALLTGVIRAFPFADVAVERMVRKHGDTLFRLCHSESVTTSLQALNLLHRFGDFHQSVHERFYRTLYAKMLNRSLSHGSSSTMFLKLVYLSVKQDVVRGRSLALTKRLIQLLAAHRPAFAAGVFLLIRRLFDDIPGLYASVRVPEDRGSGVEKFQDAPDDDDDGVERYLDVAMDDAGDAQGGGEVSGAGSSRQRGEAVFVGKNMPREGGARVRQDVDAVVLTSCGERFETFMVTSAYDAHKRAPEFCAADDTCLWEASEFTRHFHPSVGRFASALLTSEDLEYRGNPLKDMTAQAFLDKFVMRNPKAARARLPEDEGEDGEEGQRGAAGASAAKDDAYLGVPTEDAATTGRRGVRGNSFQQPITNFDDVPRMFDLSAPSTADKGLMQGASGVAFHQLYASVATAKPSRGRDSASTLRRKHKAAPEGEDASDDDRRPKRARKGKAPSRPIA